MQLLTFQLRDTDRALPPGGVESDAGKAAVTWAAPDTDARRGPAAAGHCWRRQRGPVRAWAHTSTAARW
jgi:hypothetical protein